MHGEVLGSNPRRSTKSYDVMGRTYRDRAEYIKAAVSKRRRKIKELVVEYKGGKCAVCSYDKFIGALDLHHIDRKTKSFGIAAKGYTRSWEAVKQEADKCVLLCANCHREAEAGLHSFIN